MSRRTTLPIVLLLPALLLAASFGTADAQERPFESTAVVSAPRTEIGRASCRERVSSAV